MSKPKDFDLYFITDRQLTKKTILEDVKAAVEAGVKVVQYREKKLSVRKRFDEALAVKQLCREKNAAFIVNDEVDLAMLVEADGVHLGQDDMPLEETRKLMPGKIIGVTVHNVEEAIEAEKNGADYLGVSPIYHTDTKADAGQPAGIKLLQEVKKAVSLPLVAIGGITRERLEEVIGAGADSAAMISAIVCKEDVGREAKETIEKIQELKARRKDED